MQEPLVKGRIECDAGQAQSYISSLEADFRKLQDVIKQYKDLCEGYRNIIRVLRWKK